MADSRNRRIGARQYGTKILAILDVDRGQIPAHHGLIEIGNRPAILDSQVDPGNFSNWIDPIILPPKVCRPLKICHPKSTTRLVKSQANF